MESFVYLTNTYQEAAVVTSIVPGTRDTGVNKINSYFLRTYIPNGKINIQIHNCIFIFNVRY